jgi:hypothetical protein
MLDEIETIKPAARISSPMNPKTLGEMCDATSFAFYRSGVCESRWVGPSGAVARVVSSVLLVTRRRQAVFVPSQ